VKYKIADHHRKHKRRARCLEEQFGFPITVEAAAAKKSVAELGRTTELPDLQEALLAQAVASDDPKFVKFLELDYSPDGYERLSIECLAQLLSCSSRKVSRYRAQKKKSIVAIRSGSRFGGGGAVTS
jgi:hypothetical protein